jgi:hypothetical protein
MAEKLPAERLQRIKTVQCGLPERNFFLETTMNIAKPQSFRLDKITAARRQLDTAIELLFENRDVVSICVLMHGAWSIVKDLMKTENLSPLEIG